MMTTPSTPPATSATTPIYCLHCNYDLRATPVDSPRCPECGRVFDPSNPKTFRRRPIRRWLRHVKRAAYALLTLTLILAAIWLWLFWGWYDEQQALKALPPVWSIASPLSRWLRHHAGPPGFVLDRVSFVGVRAVSVPLELTPLARLKRLDWLLLKGSAVTDLRPLAGCVNLQELNLSDSGVKDLTPLAGLMNLRELSLKNTGVTDLTPIAGLTRLAFVNLNGTRVTDLGPLMRIRSLQGVSLPKETITEAQAEELRRALPESYITRE